MSDALFQHQQAARLAGEAADLEADGSRTEALAHLREAVTRYAEAARLYGEPGEQTPPSWRLSRAEACLRFADLLAESEAHSEAAGVYQQAADAYGTLADADAQAGAQLCAHRALTSIRALRQRPEERLYLLTAHYDRLQQQLALQDDTEARQAECCTHIANVFLRRDRPVEAAERFAAALRLYERAREDPDVMLSRAECHHRLGGLKAHSLGRPAEAANHYRTAIALYAAHERPSYGHQQAHDLCVLALDELQRQYTQPDPPEEPRKRNEI